MVGEKPRPQKNFKDPFVAGQMVGMITILMYLEGKGTISDKMLQELKWRCADNAQGYFKKPSEDIFMMIDKIVKEIE